MWRENHLCEVWFWFHSKHNVWCINDGWNNIRQKGDLKTTVCKVFFTLKYQFQNLPEAMVSVSRAPPQTPGSVYVWQAGMKYREKGGLLYGSNKCLRTALDCNYDSEFHSFNCRGLQSHKNTHTVALKLDWIQNQSLSETKALLGHVLLHSEW